MIVENNAETYRFNCVRCEHTWLDQYTVHNVTDLDGEMLSFYRHDGLSCEAPLAAETLCPSCHCGPVAVLCRECRELHETELGGPPAR